MLKFLLELFVFYIIYKFVFELVLPVYNTTKHIKKKMNEVNEQLQKNQTNNQAPGKTSSNSNSSHDYIDYEEIK